MPKLNSLSQSQSTPIFIVLTVFALMSIGTVTVYSTSMFIPFNATGDPLHYVKKHILFAIASLIILLVISQIDYHFYLKKFPLVLIGIVTIGLLVAVLLFPPVNGAKRWIRVGSFSFQPSELAKLTMILFMARLVVGLQKQIKTFRIGFLVPMALTGGIASLILLERDLGTPLVFLLVGSMLMLGAGVRVWHFLVMIPLSAPVLYFLVMKTQFRFKRITSFLDPWSDPQGAGYQVIQSLTALHAGGISGVGLGKGIQKHGYLPAQFTDFIFAIIGEEMGFLGCALVVVLFVLFLWESLQILNQAADLPGAMITLGIMGFIGFQAIINIGVVTSMLPTKGIALPFVSLGGSSMLIMAAGVGILLNVGFQGNPAGEEKIVLGRAAV